MIARGQLTSTQYRAGKTHWGHCSVRLVWSGLHCTTDAGELLPDGQCWPAASFSARWRGVRKRVVRLREREIPNNNGNPKPSSYRPFLSATTHSHPTGCFLLHLNIVLGECFISLSRTVEHFSRNYAPPLRHSVAPLFRCSLLNLIATIAAAESERAISSTPYCPFFL